VLEGRERLAAALGEKLSFKCYFFTNFFKVEIFLKYVCTGNIHAEFGITMED